MTVSRNSRARRTAAFADPRLLAACPYCAKPLKYTPFVVATRQ